MCTNEGQIGGGEKWAQQVGIDTALWESTTPLESIEQEIEPVLKNTDLIGNTAFANHLLGPNSVVDTDTAKYDPKLTLVILNHFSYSRGA